MSKNKSKQQKKAGGPLPGQGKPQQQQGQQRQPAQWEVTLQNMLNVTRQPDIKLSFEHRQVFEQGVPQLAQFIQSLHDHAQGLQKKIEELESEDEEEEDETTVAE